MAAEEGMSRKAHALTQQLIQQLILDNETQELAQGEWRLSVDFQMFHFSKTERGVQLLGFGFFPKERGKLKGHFELVK